MAAGAALNAPGTETAVYLNETYEAHATGAEPGNPVLRRVKQVTVAEGGGRLGEGKVAHFRDHTDDGGALEYNVGKAGLQGLHVSFDLLNNRPDDTAAKAVLIFGVGPWNTSSSLMLNANAKRGFSVEFSQTGAARTLALRVGSSAVLRSAYDLDAPQHVQIWVNDRDDATLTYHRPDNGKAAQLNPDSFVVWINGTLVEGQPAFGYAMQTSVTRGAVGLGRVGFSSSSTGRADFLLDNFRVTDPTGESVPVAPGQVLPSTTEEATPEKIPGGETFDYREGENSMKLFVFKPEGWNAGERRSALMYFFGGGWTRGTPEKSAGWARWAAKQGMVGIAPDYRTKNRFGTSPLAAVADGRAAFRWVMDHATELGIDPAKIVVGGTSAGGHVALWTAIESTPPGSDPAEAPREKPAALFLTSAVTDTSTASGYTPARFGQDALALSPVHQLEFSMPPVLMFHARNDALVDFRTAVSLRDALTVTSNSCELVTIPEGGHSFTREFPEWKKRMRDRVHQFLGEEDLLSLSAAP
jgi:acetyl esterase/lipase